MTRFEADGVRPPSALHFAKGLDAHLRSKGLWDDEDRLFAEVHALERRLASRDVTVGQARPQANDISRVCRESACFRQPSGRPVEDYCSHGRKPLHQCVIPSLIESPRHEPI